jgi:mannitol/fructose-specific phosphotransferase system IIA component (Ntr-type)
MKLTDYIHSCNIRFLSTRNKYSAIEDLARTFKDNSGCSDLEQLVSSLKEREEIMSTGIGFGIAIPHAKIPQISEMAFAIGISKAGIDFDSMDGIPVNLIILVIASDSQTKEYLGLLSEIMNLLRIDSVKDKIIAATTADEVLAIIHAQYGK